MLLRTQMIDQQKWERNFVVNCSSMRGSKSAVANPGSLKKREREREIWEKELAYVMRHTAIK